MAIPGIKIRLTASSHKFFARATWFIGFALIFTSSCALAVVPVKVTNNIYYAPGFGNTYMVLTDEGAVIIDTSTGLSPPQHYEALRRISSAPVKYILVTHGHGDHIDGIPVWKESGTQLIAPASHADFLHYRTRLAGFFWLRNSWQGGLHTPQPILNKNPGNFAADVPTDILFDDEYSFSLGGLTFVLKHTPGETPDHMSIWIPELRAVFVGDNFYRAWPNLFSPRGTIERPALDWVAALDVVKAWDPLIMLLSHGYPMVGEDKIRRELTKYQNGILFVHDAVVQGMNEGKDVFTLMREIKLPQELQQIEWYGHVGWSVRGIYEGYAGWFDGNITNLYSRSPWDADPELVVLAGGAQTVVNQARIRLEEGDAVAALRLAEAALRSDSESRAAWQLKLDVLNELLENARGSIEEGFLRAAITETNARIAEQP